MTQKTLVDVSDRISVHSNNTELYVEREMEGLGTSLELLVFGQYFSKPNTTCSVRVGSFSKN